MTAETAAIPEILRAAREASYTLATLPEATRNAALLAFADLLAAECGFLLAENVKDTDAQAGQLSPSMAQRLKLDAAKISQLGQGLRDVAGLPDPVNRVLSRTLLDDGLVLEKVSVPLGVIAIIFESRPDVIPQILALALKSGNAVVLKGGKEARHSNHAFMALIGRLNARFPELPPAWAQLVDTREAVHALLDYPEYVDLVIPRGSNALVQSIQAATRIPVLGHADGVCHLYVHEAADLDKAMAVVLDAKAQYPAACNALETLLVDNAIAADFLSRFIPEALAQGLGLRGDEAVRGRFTEVDAATEADWRAEYGDLTLAIRVVPDLDAAIEHVNRYGSHHTDGILSRDAAAIETFLNRVDSAGVYANASTRFADGFRYGFGAEVGISTAKTHARGPVGLDGLTLYKYKLRGDSHRVADYVGPEARAFRHHPLDA